MTQVKLIEVRIFRAQLSRQVNRLPQIVATATCHDPSAQKSQKAKKRTERQIDGQMKRFEKQPHM